MRRSLNLSTRAQTSREPCSVFKALSPGKRRESCAKHPRRRQASIGSSRPFERTTSPSAWATSAAAGAASLRCAVAEATDPVAVQKWVLDWSDLLDLEVRAVITDEQLGEALAAM